MDGEKRELLERYSRLDEQGQRAVRAVAAIELLRVSDPEGFKAFGKKLDDLAVSPAAAE